MNAVKNEQHTRQCCADDVATYISHADTLSSYHADDCRRTPVVPSSSSSADARRRSSLSSASSSYIVIVVRQVRFVDFNLFATISIQMLSKRFCFVAYSMQYDVESNDIGRNTSYSHTFSLCTTLDVVLRCRSVMVLEGVSLMLILTLSKYATLKACLTVSNYVNVVLPHTFMVLIIYTHEPCYLLHSNSYVMFNKLSKEMYLMTVLLPNRSNDINVKVSSLLYVLPYPLTWYDTLADNRIEAIYRENHSRVMDILFAHDDEKVNRRLYNTEHKKGVWSIVCINKCSLRFMYLSHTGKEIHGTISTYATKGYELAKGSKLANDDMCLTWQHGKQEILSRTLLISKVLASAVDDPKEVVQAINSLRRTK